MNIIYNFNYDLLAVTHTLLGIGKAAFAHGLGVNKRTVNYWIRKKDIPFEKFVLMCIVYRLNPTKYIYTDDDSYSKLDVVGYDMPMKPHFNILIREVMTKNPSLTKNALDENFHIGDDRYKEMMNNDKAAWAISMNLFLDLVNLSRTDINNIIGIENGKFPHIIGYDYDTEFAIDEDTDDLAEDFIEKNSWMVREGYVEQFKESVYSSKDNLKKKIGKDFMILEE